MRASCWMLPNKPFTNAGPSITAASCITPTVGSQYVSIRHTGRFGQSPLAEAEERCYAMLEEPAMAA